MTPIVLALLIAAACLGAALFGLWLRPKLAEHHLVDENRSLVGNITGLVTSITALMLSLLIASANGTYNAVSDEVNKLAVNLVEMDRALAQYGPEAAEVRVLLQRVAVGQADRIWPHAGRPDPGAIFSVRADPDYRRLNQLVRNLSPQIDAQRTLQAEVLGLLADGARTRVMLANQLNNQLLLPIIIVVGFWLVMVFLGYGLLVTANAVSIVALSVGAISVGGALFLLLALNRPFAGLMAIDGAAVRHAISLLGN